mgnify:CR=1 FL=1|jgi:hypothetical protein
MSGKCQLNVFCFQKMPTANYSILLNLFVNFEVCEAHFKKFDTYFSEDY